MTHHKFNKTLTTCGQLISQSVSATIIWNKVTCQRCVNEAFK